jgi:hypothetical protein
MQNPLLLALPMLGMSLYVSLVSLARRQGVVIPRLTLALLLLCYGGLLQILVAGATGAWSGLAFLGAALLVFVGAPVLGVQGIRLSVRADSAWHRVMGRFGLAFPAVLGLGIVGAMLLAPR